MYRRIKTLEPRPAIVGRIKIGALGEKRTSKAGGTYQLPVKLDHFLVTKMERDKETGNFLPDLEIMAQLGAECRELDVQLVDDDIEVVFPHSLSYYAGKKCLCRGDGETAERREHLLKVYGPEDHPEPMVPDATVAVLKEKMKTGDYGAWAKTVCPPETCRFFTVKDESKPRCKALGRLYVTLPRYRPMLGGVYVLVTTSGEGIRSIVYTLEEIQSRTGGILEGIPLKLRLYPKTDETERGPLKSWKLALVFDPGKDLMDKALGERAREIAALRTAAVVDLRPLRAARRQALAEADREILEVVELEPVPESEASGFHGGAPAGNGGSREPAGAPVAGVVPATVEPKPEPAAPVSVADGKPEAAKPATVSVPIAAPGETDTLPF
jgi:hypothetical protein